MQFPLQAKRSTKYHAAVITRDKGRCQLCYLNCLRLQESIEDFQSGGFYRAAQLILKNHELPAPDVGQKCFQIDHIIPIALGGKTSLNNLRLLCILCHQEETNNLKSLLARLPDKIRGQRINRGNI